MRRIQFNQCLGEIGDPYPLEAHEVASRQIWRPPFQHPQLTALAVR
jgi:hypothetical protein